jgi:hypothetical protein
MSDIIQSFYDREGAEARAAEICKIPKHMTKNSDTYPTITEDMDEINPAIIPNHYGGAQNPYEAIKVIEAWNLSFNLGNVVKYISRAGKKDAIIQELEKAQFYLNREINNLKSK